MDDIEEPQQRVVGNEQMVQLGEALRQLSYEQREVVLLHSHGQMTFTPSPKTWTFLPTRLRTRSEKNYELSAQI